MIESTPGATPRRLSPSRTTQRATAFVTAHLAQAEALGMALGDLIDDPDAFIAATRAGFRDLADEEYRAAQGFVSPGVAPVLGIRNPLREATGRGLRRSTRGVHAGRLIAVTDRLLRGEFAEERWFGVDLLGRVLPDDPERGWQLARRVARAAGDWITIDTLGRVVAHGVLVESYRWAELEQLVFSPSRWERRLVGSAVAQMPFADRTSGREPDVARRGLELIGALIGDGEPDVQRALSWALRSLTVVDLEAVTTFCLVQARLARASGDGRRAWVLRDAAPKLGDTEAAAVRTLLSGIRRPPGRESTSTANEIAARFGDLRPPVALARPADPPIDTADRSMRPTIRSMST